MMAPFCSLKSGLALLTTILIVTTGSLALVPHHCDSHWHASSTGRGLSQQLVVGPQPLTFRRSASRRTNDCVAPCCAASSLAALPPKSSTSLSLSSSSNDSSSESSSSSSSLSISAPFGIVWVCLVAWAFSSVAPGSLGSAQDTAMINAIIANPVTPGINELYYTFFNFFATIPIILASLVLPQGRPQGIPAAPFLLLSAFFGYFAAGPYLTLRAPPIDNMNEKPQLSWFTSTVSENKLFSTFILLFTMYLPIAANLIGAYQTDPIALWDGFVDLISTSRFAAVSLVDITILYGCGVALTPRDYRLRKPDATNTEAIAVAAATAILPIIGSALYCAIRPKLPEPAESS